MMHRMSQNQNQNQHVQQSRHGNNNPISKFFEPANIKNSAQRWKIGSIKDPLFREPDEGMGSIEMVTRI